MEIKTRNAIIQCFQKLEIDCSRDVELSRGFFVLSLIKSMTSAKGNFHACVNDKSFMNLLNDHKIDFFVPYKQYSDEHGRAIDFLCKTLGDHHLFDYRVFFGEFAPYIVGDWDRFTKIFPEVNENKVGRMLATLTYILQLADRLVEDDKTQCLVPNELMSKDEKVKKHWENILQLKPEDFVTAWEAIFKHRCVKVQTKINGAIKNAIEKYRSYYVPLERLLEDYYTIRSHGKNIEKAMNPWLYVYKGIMKNPVETSVSVSETLFELAAFAIKDERPSDVIRSLFYPKSANDSTFECSFLFDELFARITPGSRVLIVHPNPDFIIKWMQKTSKCDGLKTFFAVPNRVFADLYKREFPGAEFVPFSGISSLRNLDIVLFTPRSLPVSEVKQIFFALTGALGKKAEILVLLPNVLFDNSHDVQSLMLENHLHIQKMVVCARAAFHSSPRKKVLLHLDFGKELSPDTFPIYYLDTWADGDFYIYKEHWYRNEEKYLKSNLTVQTLFNQAVDEKKRIKAGCPEKKRRDAADRYSFSNEIIIFYTIQANRKNRFAGKAYYCESIIEEGSTRKHGRRITESIEKGLRAETEAEVIRNIETIPFDGRVCPYIVADICKTYAGKMGTLSLKTLWFCLRSKLLSSRDYSEEIALRLFCGEEQGLSDIVPEQAIPQDYQTAMDSLLENESKATQLRYWRQLNLIFQSAIAFRYFKINPVAQFVYDLSNQATEEQREVRNALTKKTFTTDEEAKILQFICAETRSTVDSEVVYRFEMESIWLAGAIKLFTGMPTREVCALRWSDYVKIPETDAYQLLVTKFVDASGHLINHVSNSDLKKYRRVPVAPALAAMLNRRYDYLKNREKDIRLDRQPIVLAKEDAADDTAFCKPSYATRKCREIIAAADIPEQLLMLPDADNQRETDINRFYGDIFQTNFRFRANHTCGLTKGEINYILGVEPPDTFARHYCDYTNDFVQYAVTQKFQRWTSAYQILTSSIPESPTSKEEGEYIVTPSSDGVAAADISLKARDDGAGMIEISVDCDLGFECNVVLQGEESAVHDKSGD